MTLTVGLIQTRTPATQEAALAHVLPLVRQAAAEGARLILTPECTNVLQKDRSRLVLFPQNQDPVVAALRDEAKALGVYLAIGSALVRRPDGKAANREIVLGPDGAILATYDKMHMFDVDLPNGETARESAVYEPGTEAVVASLPAGDFGAVKVGLTICYDVRFPALHRALALAGAEVILAPAAFTRPTGEAHWHVLLRARAIETGSFVLAAAQGGFHEDGRGTYGHSLVVDPWGAVIAELDHDEPGVLIADLDLSASGKARTAIPALKNARSFTAPEAVS